MDKGLAILILTLGSLFVSSCGGGSRVYEVNSSRVYDGAKFEEKTADVRLIQNGFDNVYFRICEEKSDSFMYLRKEGTPNAYGKNGRILPGMVKAPAGRDTIIKYRTKDYSGSCEDDFIVNLEPSKQYEFQVRSLDTKKCKFEIYETSKIDSSYKVKISTERAYLPCDKVQAGKSYKRDNAVYGVCNMTRKVMYSAGIKYSFGDELCSESAELKSNKDVVNHVMNVMNWIIVFEAGVSSIDAYRAVLAYGNPIALEDAGRRIMETLESREEILDMIAEALLNQYAGASSRKADSLRWLVKALTDSGKNRYKSVIEEVVAYAPDEIMRDHAKAHSRNLRKEPQPQYKKGMAAANLYQPLKTHKSINSSAFEGVRSKLKSILEEAEIKSTTEGQQKSSFTI